MDFDWSQIPQQIDVESRCTTSRTVGITGGQNIGITIEEYSRDEWREAAVADFGYFHHGQTSAVGMGDISIDSDAR